MRKAEIDPAVIVTKVASYSAPKPVKVLAPVMWARKHRGYGKAPDDGSPWFARCASKYEQRPSRTSGFSGGTDIGYPVVGLHQGYPDQELTPGALQALEAFTLQDFATAPAANVTVTAPEGEEVRVTLAVATSLNGILAAPSFAEAHAKYLAESQAAKDAVARQTAGQQRARRLAANLTPRFEALSIPATTRTRPEDSSYPLDVTISGSAAAWVVHVLEEAQRCGAYLTSYTGPEEGAVPRISTERREFYRGLKDMLENDQP